MANQLEASLEGVFKKTPKISDKARNVIVEWAPWADLVIGLFMVWAVYWLWHWAHVANALVDYANQLSASLGYGTVASTRMGAMVWVGLVVLAVEAVLYLAAFPGLKSRSKGGWNLVFWAAILNAVYGIVALFTDYGGFGNFLGYVIGTLVGLWILFQIKPAYK